MLVISGITALILISIINFANLKVQYSPTLSGFLGKIDVLNKFYLSCDIQDITQLFPSDYKRKKYINFIVIHQDADTTKDYSPMLAISKHSKDKSGNTFPFHYYINRKGTLFKCHDDWLETNHFAGNNDKSLGVCLQGNFNDEYATPEQLAGLTNLLLYLKNIHQVASNNIIKHTDTKTSKCPGKNIDLQAVRQHLNKNHFLDSLFSLFRKWYSSL